MHSQESREVYKLPVRKSPFSFPSTNLRLGHFTLPFPRLVKLAGAFARAQFLSSSMWTMGTSQPQRLRAVQPGCGVRLQLIKQLGVMPNLPKCDLVPSQKFDVVGIPFNLITWHGWSSLTQTSELPEPDPRFLQITGTSTSQVAIGGPHTAPHDSWDQSASSPFQPGIIPQGALQTLHW